MHRNRFDHLMKCIHFNDYSKWKWKEKYLKMHPLNWPRGSEFHFIQNWFAKKEAKSLVAWSLNVTEHDAWQLVSWQFYTAAIPTGSFLFLSCETGKGTYSNSTGRKPPSGLGADIRYDREISVFAIGAKL